MKVLFYSLYKKVHNYKNRKVYSDPNVHLVIHSFTKDFLVIHGQPRKDVIARESQKVGGKILRERISVIEYLVLYGFLPSQLA